MIVAIRPLCWAKMRRGLDIYLTVRDFDLLLVITSMTLKLTTNVN